MGNDDGVRFHAWAETTPRAPAEVRRAALTAAAIAAARRPPRPHALGPEDVPVMFWDDENSTLYSVVNGKSYQLAASTWVAVEAVPAVAIALGPLAGVGHPNPLASDPRGRTAPEPRYEVEVSATLKTGGAFPSPVGPFHDEQSAWGWWWAFGQPQVDPKWSTEVGVNPIYLPWKSS